MPVQADACGRFCREFFGVAISSQGIATPRVRIDLRIGIAFVTLHCCEPGGPQARLDLVRGEKEEVQRNGKPLKFVETAIAFAGVE